MQKLSNYGKINYDENDSEDYYQDESSKDLQVNNISTILSQESPSKLSYSKFD